MNKTTQVFTRDAILSLQNAQLIALHHQISLLDAERIFWGSYGFVRETDQFSSFAAILGIQKAQHLDRYYLQHYHPLIKDQKSVPFEKTLHVDTTFNNQLLNHQKERKLRQLDFGFLFYISFLHLSNESQVFQLLKNDHIDYHTTLSNCKKLLFNPISKQQGVFAFLKILSKIFQNIPLDFSKISVMNINVNDHLENLERSLDSVESEIGQDFEQPIDANGTTTKKKEEKRLNIEYFGTDLTKESKEGFIDPIIGREQEINQVIYTLLRKTKNNPLLI